MAIGIRAAAGATILLVAGLTACTSGSPPDRIPTGTLATIPTSSSASSPQGSPPASHSKPAATTAAPTTAAPLPSGVPGAPRDIATGLNVPWSIAVLPDGSALVSLRDEKRIVHIRPDGTKTPVRATGPDGTVPGVVPGGEGGLLGLAVSPGFARDSLVYAYCSRANDNAVIAMKLTGNTLGAPHVIVSGIPRSVVHNGGRLKFGPDGYLYISTGDATARGDAQNRDLLNGKILRVTADGRPAPGNPFGTLVWSYGHRNVQGLGWAADGTMYASEFGQNTWDELNRIKPGANYGWPVVEGQGGAAAYTDPLTVWPTAEASPSGILVTADAIYLAALKGQRLWRVPLRPSGEIGTPQAYFTRQFGRLRDVVLAPDRKSLWVLTSNTFRGTPKPGDDRLMSIPLT